MWKEGTICIPRKDGGFNVIHFWIKVYEVGSKFGINGGKISKLMLKLNSEIIANYDRGWDIEPSTEEAETALYILLSEHN